MLPTDIIHLVLTYATEPIYRLIPEISERIDLLPYGCFGSNPKMYRDILSNPKKYNIYQIILNPHPKLRKELIRRAEEHIKNKPNDDVLYKQIVSIRTKDQEFSKWVEKKIFNYADKLSGNNNNWVGNIINWFLSDKNDYNKLFIGDLIIEYKSKKFYDKYKSYTFHNIELLLIKYAKYPFFLDITKEENEIEFIRMLHNIAKYTNDSIPEIQKINHPAIINELEIIYGLKSDKFSSEFIRKMMGLVENRYLTMNCGTIHILTKFPDLIEDLYVYSNPKLTELIISGQINHPKTWAMAHRLKNINYEPFSRITYVLSADLGGDIETVNKFREYAISEIDRRHNCIFANVYTHRLIKLVCAYIEPNIKN